MAKFANEKRSVATVTPDGSTIRELRKRQGFRNQKELAVRADVCERSIRNIEHNKDALPSTIRCVATALGVPYEKLVLSGAEQAAAMERDATVSDRHASLHITIDGDLYTLDQCAELLFKLYQLADEAGLEHPIVVARITRGSVILWIRVEKEDANRLVSKSYKLRRFGVVEVARATPIVFFRLEPDRQGQGTPAQLGRRFYSRTMYDFKPFFSLTQVTPAGYIWTVDMDWKGDLFYDLSLPSGFGPSGHLKFDPFSHLVHLLDLEFRDGPVWFHVSVDGLIDRFLVGSDHYTSSPIAARFRSS
jgi:transcriptional regulator with XRE-family HTH domain